MKHYILFACILLAFGNLKAQQLNLPEFNKERLNLQRKGMYVLGGWGLGNTIVSIASLPGSSGATKYFHQMNIGWGAVNATLAGFTLLTHKRQMKKESGYNYAQSMGMQTGVEKTFLLNLGLDAAYVLGGVAFNESSNGTKGNSKRKQGFGNAIIMNGAFLMLFDGVMYTLHNRHGKKLRKQLDKVNVSLMPGQVSLLVKL